MLKKHWAFMIVVVFVVSMPLAYRYADDYMNNKKCDQKDMNYSSISHKCVTK